MPVPTVGRSRLREQVIALDLPIMGRFKVLQLDTRGRYIVNIGEAARRSGISAKMIRYYESIGLIPKAGRTAAGYRNYSSDDLRALQFLKRARNLGFSAGQTMELQALWGDRNRASADVKRLVLAHVAALETKIAELRGIQRALKHVAAQCRGDHRPECPIIEELARGEIRQFFETNGQHFSGGKLKSAAQTDLG
jgi:Cu(I)-responsive transcriptional regulator